ncbi:MAG: hypothetical protein ACFFAN_17125 [Promethearchaeota archaeon]
MGGVPSIELKTFYFKRKAIPMTETRFLMSIWYIIKQTNISWSSPERWIPIRIEKHSELPFPLKGN